MIFPRWNVRLARDLGGVRHVATRSWSRFTRPVRHSVSDSLEGVDTLKSSFLSVAVSVVSLTAARAAVGRSLAAARPSNASEPDSLEGVATSDRASLHSASVAVTLCSVSKWGSDWPEI